MNATRRQFLLSLSAAAAAVAQDRANKPNFIIIYTDDQGIGDLGCYGASDAKTPNLDKLAASGVRFTSWYTNCPVCSPSRASLMTGKYPQRHGITEVLTSTAQFNIPGLKKGETMLPRELGKLGYRSAVIGKWHMGSAAHSKPMAQGFDEFFGFYSGWTDYYSHRYYTLGRGQSEIVHDMWRGDEEVWEDNTYQTELLTREAKAFLSRQTRERPFLLYLAFAAPHYPMTAPQKYVDRFPKTMDRDRRMHLAMISAIDDGVGEVLGLLKEKGMDRDTVVFFQSDNGSTQETRADHRGQPYDGGSNAPFRGYKMGLFEGGIRMPAIMSWPGRIPSGQVVDEAGAAMDILPTFLSMAGANASGLKGIDGKDVTAVVRSRGKSPHDALFWSYKNQRAVRKGSWKLLLNPPSFAGQPVTDKVWLSNLKDDPGEKKNWAAAHPDTVRDLRARLEEWEKQWST
ncbi:MAG: sulfatase-like hydrolase/transferase [Bryobacteraceae bacterium]